jgi:hypothetical protein
MSGGSARESRRVHDLPARVHAGVGPPRDGQPRRRGQPQHVPEGLGKNAFDGPAPRLRRPSGKPGPVIGKINSYPNVRG